MNKVSDISILSGNVIELHYFFNDDSHTMDANVQNKCEYEILGILKEIANTFGTEIIIETEPLGDGGLKRWLKVISKEENKKGTITSVIIASLLTTIIVTPLATTVSKVAEKIIEEIFEDKETKQLQDEKLKLEIQKLKQDIEINKQKLPESSIIKKKRSNFYETLEKYQKVEKVSFVLEDNNHNELTSQKVVERINFKEFVLVNDELDPYEIDDAVIEIISPVLKKGKYKWFGIYNGNSIPFVMKSKEFKDLVQSGKIQFKNGTSINCHLIIKRKIDNEGIEKTIAYDVERVNNYFENDKPIETIEGKRYRQKREADTNQMKLFDTNKDS